MGVLFLLKIYKSAISSNNHWSKLELAVKCGKYQKRRVAMKKLLQLILIVVDLCVMITAPLVIAIIAFVIGMLFLFHYVFYFEAKTEHTKKD